MLVFRTCALLVVTIALTTSLSVNAIAAPKFEEGEWEMEMKLKMDGVPVQMPPFKHKQCLTQKDFVPAQPQQPRSGMPDCKTLSQNSSGNTATWNVRCTAPDMVTDSSGKVTFGSTSVQGTTKTTLTRTGKPPQIMTHELSGKRVGPCKAEPPKR